MKISIIILVTGMLIAPELQAQKVYSLSECRQMALDNNIKMRNGKLEIDQAKEQEREAYSKYFPTVTASGSYFKAYDDLLKKKISLSTSQQQELTKTITDLGLNASALSGMPTSYTLKAINHGIVADVMAMEPLYAGGQITNGNKLAKLQTEVKKLQLQQSQDELLNTTEQYYNQLLTLYEKQHTLDAVDKQLERIHQDATNSFKAGIKNKDDVLSVELKQNEISTNRLKLENGISLCKMVLAQYIGMNGKEIQIDTTLSKNLPNPTTYYTDHATALDNRNEAKLLDKNVEANALQTKIKKGAQLPTVAVGAVALYQDLMGSGQANIVGLATVSVPISDIWTGKHGVRHQQLAEQIAREDREDNRQLLMIQMQSSYNDLVNAYKQIELAKKSLEKSAENLRLNEDYYHAGTATMSDLLEAQAKDQQSHDQYTDAVAQYLNSRTSYLIATGRQVQ